MNISGVVQMGVGEMGGGEMEQIIGEREQAKWELAKREHPIYKEQCQFYLYIPCIWSKIIVHYF